MTVRAVVRVSTEEQKVHGWSVEAQMEDIRGWAEREHPGVVVEFYDDSGWSGGERDRPALKRLFDEVESGDIIVATKVDRLYRDVSALYEFLDECSAEGVEVRFLELSGIDPLTATGKRIVGMLGVQAHGTREDIGESTVRGLARAAKSHVHIGRRPLGFEFVQEDGKRVLKPTDESMRLVMMPLRQAVKESKTSRYKIEALRDNVARWNATRPWYGSVNPENAKRRHPRHYTARYRRNRRNRHVK